MATRQELVSRGNGDLSVDQVTAQIFEELRRVSVVATKWGNREFVFSLLGTFVDDSKITLTMVSSARIYFPQVSPRQFSPNQMCYIVTMTPPMEEAELQGVKEIDHSDHNGDENTAETIEKKGKGNKSKKMLIGAGELVLARGSLDQLVNSRQLTLDCYHPTSTFSGIEVLQVIGENCLAVSPQAYLSGLLKKQKWLDRALAGYDGLRRKSSETNWAEEVKNLKELLKTERISQSRLLRDYNQLEDQMVDLRIAQITVRTERESERGQLLYSLAQDLVAHLIRKGEYNSEGIVLCPSIEHTPIRVNFERKLRLSNIEDKPLLVFTAGVEKVSNGTDVTNGKNDVNGDTVYPSQNVRYYRNFGTTYGSYLGAERFSEDIPLPALMAKLIEVELRGKEELPSLTPLLLEKRVAGFTSEHIDQALSAGLLVYNTGQRRKQFDDLSWSSVQKTLFEIYPYLERYHHDFANTKTA